MSKTSTIPCLIFSIPTNFTPKTPSLLTPRIFIEKYRFWGGQMFCACFRVSFSRKFHCLSRLFHCNFPRAQFLQFVRVHFTHRQYYLKIHQNPEVWVLVALCMSWVVLISTVLRSWGICHTWELNAFSFHLCFRFSLCWFTCLIPDQCIVS